MLNDFVICSYNYPIWSLFCQGPPGITGPKGQRGERVSPTYCTCELSSVHGPNSLRLYWLSSYNNAVIFSDSMICCLNVFTQGEPGYVIAGTDSNFVPGRKGEPGSSVSYQEKKTKKCIS